MSESPTNLKLLHALYHSSDLIAISNFNSYFTELNQKWEEVTGYTIEELKSRPLFEFIHPDDRNMSQEEAQALYDGKPETIKFENRYIKKNGEIIWLEWNSVMDYELKLSFSIAREITNYKIASIFGDEAKQLMTDLVAYAMNPIQRDDYIDYVLHKLLLLYQADCISFWDFNEQEQSIHCKHSKERDTSKSRVGLSLQHDAAPSYFEAILNNKLVIAPDTLNNANTIELKSYFETYQVKSLLDGVVNEGLSKCVLCIETTDQRDWSNQETNTLLAITNIVSNYLSHQQIISANNELRQALEEKNILFKELHHRIKNNLNMVSNLLSLKSMIAKSPELEEFVKETKNRIYSISKTHDQLLKLQELDQLNVKEYLIDLVNNVVQSYTSEPDIYPVKYAVENHKVKVDLILTIGLLTNEIVSNSIKYAYDPQIGGEIMVRFALQENAYVLELGDQGKGMQTEQRDSLGLTLIDLLVKQLKGSLLKSTIDGLTYKINIPLDE